MTQTSPTGEHRVSTSFTHGERHEGGTTRFQGTVESVTRDIIDWFGLTNTDDLTPFEIALRADQLAQACDTVITTLAATPITQEQATPAPEASSPTDRVSGGDPVGRATDPWQAAEQSTQPNTPSMFATDPTESAASAVSAVPAGQAPPARTGTSLLYARIERAASVEKLHRLWAENQAAFADDELMAAWKARGRALQQDTPDVAAGNASTNTGSTQGVAA